MHGRVGHCAVRGCGIVAVMPRSVQAGAPLTAAPAALTRASASCGTGCCLLADAEDPRPVQLSASHLPRARVCSTDEASSCYPSVQCGDSRWTVADWLTVEHAMLSVAAGASRTTSTANEDVGSRLSSALSLQHSSEARDSHRQRYISLTAARRCRSQPHKQRIDPRSSKQHLVHARMHGQQQDE